ncbi:hypothetical protein IC582_000463 [Cucumis melo]
MSHSSEWLLQLLQRFLKNSTKIPQIHALLLTQGHLFNNSQTSSNPKCLTTLLYNTLIRAYLTLNRPRFALLLYTQMLSQQTKPNFHTFPSIIKSATIYSPLLPKLIHAHAFKIGVLTDPVVLTSFVSSYGDLRELGNARKVFDEITDPCIVAFNSMLDAFVKNGDLGSAVFMFRYMPERDVVSWTSVVNGFWWNGRFLEALWFFQMMMMSGSVKPNEATYVTFVAILTACARGKLVKLGLQLFQSMLYDFSIVPITEHYVCVVDLLGKAGLLREATEIIESMPFDPDASVLGALLSACKIHGAIELGNEVGRRLLVMQPRHCGRYVTLASMNAGAEKWNRAAVIRSVMADARIQKTPAYSRVDPMQNLVLISPS